MPRKPWLGVEGEIPSPLRRVAMGSFEPLDELAAIALATHLTKHTVVRVA